MSHPVFDITGQVALVSGSTRGLGFAIAGSLLEAGCTVVVNGRSPEATRSAARDLRADGVSPAVHAVAFDVSDEQAVRAAVAAAEGTAGPIGILVNNAGLQHRAPLLDFPAAAWQDLIAVNLTGPFLLGREVAARMAARGAGKIINICSVTSELARPGISAYTAAKGGLKMLTQSMCAELAPLGIQVNGIGPGYFALCRGATRFGRDIHRHRPPCRMLRFSRPAGKRWQWPATAPRANAGSRRCFTGSG